MAQTYTIGTAEGVIRITYDPAGVAAAKKDQEALGASSVKAGSAMSKSAKVMAVGGLLIAAGLGEAAKQASDFQAKMTLLVTAGGESQAMLGKVSKGIEDISIQTGTSLDQLADGMYIVEKAGKRGAAGLDVLKAAAEGAKAEGTDLTVMTQGLTSIMQSYAATMKNPVQATNELVAAAGMAKTTMQDFVNALPNVLPLASAVGISFAQVGGAMATLTQHGTTAAEASQELNNTIRGLVAPNQVAMKAMQQLGINVVDLEKNVGKRGLAGSIELVVDAIGKKLGPAGLVVVDTFKKSQSAGQDLQTMLGTMPADLKKLSQGFLDGTVSAKDYRMGFKDMGAQGNAMGTQFMSLATQASGFNDLLKSGSPAAATFTAYLKQIMGGATGMNTALQLSGESTTYLNNAIATINKSAGESGKDISTWATTQKNASVQMGRLKSAGEVLAVNLGTQVLPAIIGIAKALSSMVQWFADLSSGWQKTIVIALAFVASLLLIASTFKKLEEAAKALKALALFLKLDVLWTNLMAAATKAWALIQGILDVELTASGITLVIAAIVALVAAVILIIKYHKQLGAFFAMIWGKIWSLMKTIGSWFAGPFVGFFKTVGKGIMDAINPVWSFLKAVGAWFAGPFVNFFTSAWSDIVGAFDAARAVVMAVVNAIETILQGMFAVIQKIIAPFVPLFKAVFELVLAVVTLIWKLIWALISFELMLIINGVKLALSLLTAAWNASWNFIKSIATTVWNAIVSAVTIAINFVLGIVRSVMTAIVSAWDAAWNAVKAVVMRVWDFIKPYIQAAIAVIKGYISAGINAAKAVWSAVWGSIEAVAKAVWGKIKSALAPIGALGKTVGGYFKGAYDAAVAAVGTLITFCKGIGAKVLKAIGNLSKLLYNAGKSIIQGLIDGLTSMIGKLTSKLHSITKMIPSFKGPIEVDSKLLTPNGMAIMGSLMDGIEASIPGLKKMLQGLTTSIPLNVSSGATQATYVNQMTSASASTSAAKSANHGPYQMTLDGKVLAEFVVDTVTGEPKMINDTANEGARVTSWAGSGRKGSV